MGSIPDRLNLRVMVAFVASVCLLVVTGTPVQSALMDPDDLRIGGWVREYISMNLEDVPETPQDDKNDLSMLRTSLQVDLDYRPKRWLGIRFIGRESQELPTDYMDRLERQGAADLKDVYEDQDTVRELYVDLSVTERLDLRLGKQQVSWGKTDFFQTMDIIHGFDFRWRNFLESAQDTRQPLWMANMMYEMPELGGNLQVLYRPGYDDDKRVVNLFDLRGGRWASQPGRTTDFLTTVPFNFDHPSGNPEDGSYGARFSGLAFNNLVEYSVAYYHNYNRNPVVNSIVAPYKGSITSVTGFEFIHPEIDLVGGSFNYYIQSLDIVARGEAAMTFDKPYNVGTNTTCTFGGVPFPGFCGIREKDSINWMLNFDRQVDTVEWLLASDRPGFLSIQIFDEWIPSYDSSENLVDLAGFGAPQEEHQSLITAILSWHYMNDRINPQIAVVADASNGGGLIWIPSVSFVYGDHLRVTLEADLWDPDNSKSPGQVENQTHIVGYGDNANQLFTRIEWQF